MVQKVNPTYNYPDSKQDLEFLVSGDRVKFWFSSSSSRFLVYGLDLIEDLTKNTYLRFIEIPEFKPEITSYNIIGKYLDELEFKDGILLLNSPGHFHLYKADNPVEFELAKNLVGKLK